MEYSFPKIINGDVHHLTDFDVVWVQFAFEVLSKRRQFLAFLMSSLSERNKFEGAGC